MSGTLFSDVNNIKSMIPEDQKNITTNINITTSWGPPGVGEIFMRLLLLWISLIHKEFELNSNEII